MRKLYVNFVLTTFVVLVILLAQAAQAAELTVPATVVSVYDGDAFRARAQIWPGHEVTVSVRVDGVDTPDRLNHRGTHQP